MFDISVSGPLVGMGLSIAAFVAGESGFATDNNYPSLLFPLTTTTTGSCCGFGGVVLLGTTSIPSPLVTFALSAWHVYDGNRDDPDS